MSGLDEVDNIIIVTLRQIGWCFEIPVIRKGVFFICVSLFLVIF